MDILDEKYFEEFRKKYQFLDPSDKPGYYELVLDGLYKYKDDFFPVSYLSENIKKFKQIDIKILAGIFYEMEEITRRLKYHPYVDKKIVQGVDYYRLNYRKRLQMDNPSISLNEARLEITDSKNVTFFYDNVIEELYKINDLFYSAKQLKTVVPLFRHVQTNAFLGLLEEMYLVTMAHSLPLLDKKTHHGVDYFRLHSERRAKLHKERKFNDSYKIKIYDEENLLFKCWERVSRNYLLSGIILLLIVWLYRHISK